MKGIAEYDTLQVHRAGWRLDITLDRPMDRNALTHAMMREIGAAVAWARAEEGLRAIVLRGAAGTFCAGGDLNFIREMPPPPAVGEVDPLYAAYRFFGEVLEDLNTLPQVVVAVVEGPAVGGGFGLVCCADVVIAGADAIFALPEPRVGFIPSQLLPFVVRRIGEGAARRLAVTGARIGAAEARAIGLVHHVCDDRAAVEARLARTLDEVRRCEPGAVSTVKRLILSVAERTREEVCDDAGHSLVRLLREPAARAGIQSFLAKRDPPWAT
jgi:isohexenylglutaconyl-CoA hydratase